MGGRNGNSVASVLMEATGSLGIGRGRGCGGGVWSIFGGPGGVTKA